MEEIKKDILLYLEQHIGEFKDDEKDGRGMCTFSNGNVYIGGSDHV